MKPFKNKKQAPPVEETPAVVETPAEVEETPAVVETPTKKEVKTVTVLNHVGLRRLELGGQNLYIRSGNNVMPVKTWEAIKQDKHGKKLVDDKVIENITEKANK